ncbi:MAG: hypothetical protein P8X94_11995, partial [Woeseiaceae bacterium]
RLPLQHLHITFGLLPVQGVRYLPADCHWSIRTRRLLLPTDNLGLLDPIEWRRGDFFGRRWLENATAHYKTWKQQENCPHHFALETPFTQST